MIKLRRQTAVICALLLIIQYLPSSLLLKANAKSSLSETNIVEKENTEKIEEDTANKKSAEDTSENTDKQDTECPTAVENLNYIINDDGSVTLTWDASIDNEVVTGYKIYNGGTEIGKTTELTYTISEIAKLYDYSVAAVDEAGNQSDKSGVIIVIEKKVVPNNEDETRTSNKQDTECPAAVENLSYIVNDDGSVTLTWDASADNEAVTGYKIYNSGTEIGTTTELTYTISEIAEPYDYSVAAIDETGNESDKRNISVILNQDAAVLAAPENLSYTINDENTITLVWDPVDGAEYYDLLINDILITDVDSTTYVYEKTTPGEMYTIKVRAKSSTNRSKEIEAVKIPTATAVSADTTTSSWSDSIIAETAASTITISENTVWTKENSPYELTGHVIVASGVTLTIEAGVVIESTSTSNYLTVKGTLNATGTIENPVVFTNTDDPLYGGSTASYWNGIQSTSTGVINLDYAEIRYGGYSTSSKYSICSEGELNMKNSAVINSRYNGIYAEGDTSITNSEITSYSRNGIYLATSSADVTVMNNQITGEGDAGIYIESCEGGSLAVTGNTVSGSTYPVLIILTQYSPRTVVGLEEDGIGLSGDVTSNLTLKEQTYLLDDDITVKSGTTLTIPGGTVIKAKESSQYIDVDGILNATGAIENPVVFTNTDDPLYGGSTVSYWHGIKSGSKGVINLSYAEVRYGGNGAPSDYAVYSEGELHMSNSAVIYPEHNGIYAAGETSITNSAITGFKRYGINIAAESADVTMMNNQITGDGDAGIYIESCEGGSLTVTGNTVSGSSYPVLISLTKYNPATVAGLEEDGIGLSGDVTSDLTLKEQTYLLADDVTVKSGATLTIPAGTVIKATKSSQYIDVDGILNATGAIENPVVFTNTDDPFYGGSTASYWTGIGSGSTGVINLSYAEIRYGGNSTSYKYSIRSEGELNMTNSSVINSKYNGIYVGGETNISDSEIKNYSDNGVYMATISSDVTVINNQIAGEGDAGIYIESCEGGNLTITANALSGNVYPILIKLTKYSPTTMVGLEEDGIGLSGYVNSNLTLKEHTYLLDGAVTVASGATLTIPAGAIIKATKSAQSIDVDGILNVNGTAENPAVFTNTDDPLYGGSTASYWDGIESGSAGIINLNYAEIRYGGDGDPSAYAVSSKGGLNMSNSAVIYPEHNGIYAAGETNISVSTITDFTKYGINIAAESVDITVVNNQIAGEGDAGIYIESYEGGNLTVTGNTVSGSTYPILIKLNDYNPVTVVGLEEDVIGLSGTVASDFTLNDQTYLLGGTVTVASGATLTIPAGAVIKATESSQSIDVDGILNVNGTAEAPAVFTTTGDYQYGGNDTSLSWEGFNISSKGILNLDYADVKYAGHYGKAINTHGQLNITNSSVNNSPDKGIYLDTAFQPVIQHNSFINNESYSVYNENARTMTVDASNNYWGSDAGPALYVSGEWTTDGGKISDGVTYIPYLSNLDTVTADLIYSDSTVPSDAISARVTVYNYTDAIKRSYFVEVYCSWDEETWYYKNGSEVIIPAGQLNSYVDLDYTIYQTGNLYSKVVIYADNGHTQLNECIKNDTDYVAVWYHITAETSEGIELEQYLSSVEDIENDTIYLICKQSDEELWKQYVLEDDAWVDTGITYDIEPFTEGWILNDGSESPLRSILPIQSSNPIENFKYNIVDLVKTTPYEAETIIWNNVDNILDAAADNEVDPQIVAGVIYVEQAYNVNIRDNLDAFPAFYGIADTSIGIGQVRMSTAELLEDQGYVTKSTEYKVGWNIPGVGFVHCTETMTRERRLENDQQNVIYVAAYLKYWQDMWKGVYPQISEDPAILGTLYNLGVRANPPNPNPESNPFGDLVEENYDYMGELLYYLLN